MVSITSCNNQGFHWLLDFPACLLHPDAGYFFLCSFLPVTHLLFLMQIIAQFLRSLLSSILCGLFGLYTSGR